MNDQAVHTPAQRRQLTEHIWIDWRDPTPVIPHLISAARRVQIADLLKAHPYRWAQLISDAANLRVQDFSTNAVYRPSSHYRAKGYNGMVYARYIGRPGRDLDAVLADELLDDFPTGGGPLDNAPVLVRWVDHPPVPNLAKLAAANSQEWIQEMLTLAKTLRSNPHRWAAVHASRQLQVRMFTGTTCLRSFRPSGSFEARAVGGEMFVRCVDPHPPVAVEANRWNLTSSAA